MGWSALRVCVGSWERQLSAWFKNFPWMVLTCRKGQNQPVPGPDGQHLPDTENALRSNNQGGKNGIFSYCCREYPPGLTF